MRECLSVCVHYVCPSPCSIPFMCTHCDVYLHLWDAFLLPISYLHCTAPSHNKKWKEKKRKKRAVLNAAASAQYLPKLKEREMQCLNLCRRWSKKKQTKRNGKTVNRRMEWARNENFDEMIRKEKTLQELVLQMYLQIRYIPDSGTLLNSERNRANRRQRRRADHKDNDWRWLLSIGRVEIYAKQSNCQSTKRWLTFESCGINKRFRLYSCRMGA